MTTNNPSDRPTNLFRDGQFWDRFGRGILPPEQRPTTQEAADFIISLFVEIEKLKQEVATLEQQRKIAAQQFSVFLMEVSNVANRYRFSA